MDDKDQVSKVHNSKIWKLKMILSKVKTKMEYLKSNPITAEGVWRKIITEELFVNQHRKGDFSIEQMNDARTTNTNLQQNYKTKQKQIQSHHTQKR